MSRQLLSVEVGTSEVVVPHKRVHDGVSSIVVPNGGKVAGIVTRLGLYAIVMGIASG